jgi:transposase
MIIPREFIPIKFDRQILPGTFEYTLHYLIDKEIDLSEFDLRYRNDETGAPAYDPAILLRIILYAYSRGITSSRKIAQCCQENIIFMALWADTRPHFNQNWEIHRFRVNIPTISSLCNG